MVARSKGSINVHKALKGPSSGGLRPTQSQHGWILAQIDHSQQDIKIQFNQAEKKAQVMQKKMAKTQKMQLAKTMRSRIMAKQQEERERMKAKNMLMRNRASGTHKFIKKRSDYFKAEYEKQVKMQHDIFQQLFGENYAESVDSDEKIDEQQEEEEELERQRRNEEIERELERDARRKEREERRAQKAAEKEKRLRQREERKALKQNLMDDAEAPLSEDGSVSEDDESSSSSDDDLQKESSDSLSALTNLRGKYEERRARELNYAIIKPQAPQKGQTMWERVQGQATKLKELAALQRAQRFVKTFVYFYIFLKNLGEVCVPLTGQRLYPVDLASIALEADFLWTSEGMAFQKMLRAKKRKPISRLEYVVKDVRDDGAKRFEDMLDPETYIEGQEKEHAQREAHMQAFRAVMPKLKFDFITIGGDGKQNSRKSNPVRNPWTEGHAPWRRMCPPVYSPRISMQEYKSFTPKVWAKLTAEGIMPSPREIMKSVQEGGTAAAKDLKDKSRDSVSVSKSVRSEPLRLQTMENTQLEIESFDQMWKNDTASRPPPDEYEIVDIKKPIVSTARESIPGTAAKPKMGFFELLAMQVQKSKNATMDDAKFGTLSEVATKRHEIKRDVKSIRSAEKQTLEGMTEEERMAKLVEKAQVADENLTKREAMNDKKSKENAPMLHYYQKQQEVAERIASGKVAYRKKANTVTQRPQSAKPPRSKLHDSGAETARRASQESVATPPRPMSARPTYRQPGSKPAKENDSNAQNVEGEERKVFMTNGDKQPTGQRPMSATVKGLKLNLNKGAHTHWRERPKSAGPKMTMKAVDTSTSSADRDQEPEQAQTERTSAQPRRPNSSSAYKKRPPSGGRQYRPQSAREMMRQGGYSAQTFSRNTVTQPKDFAQYAEVKKSKEPAANSRYPQAKPKNDPLRGPRSDIPTVGTETWIDPASNPSGFKLFS